jgi:hypothetical protein
MRKDCEGHNHTVKKVYRFVRLRTGMSLTFFYSAMTLISLDWKTPFSHLSFVRETLSTLAAVVQNEKEA